MKVNLKTITIGLAVGASLMNFAPYSAQAADAALGTAQQAGPFTVTLIAAPQLGRTRFEARVSRDGAYVTDAQVRLSLSMPYHKHGGTSDRLADVDVNRQGGQYAGSIKLKMEGIYQARVTVQSAGQKGAATYGFKVSKKAPVVHLGMWHPAGNFEVRLTTDPATPKAGENKLRVQVTRDGQPVSDAKVNVYLSMPSMKMAGAIVNSTLAAAENGYEGTAKLIHAGDWEAHINVQAGGKKGTAVYNFRAAE